MTQYRYWLALKQVPGIGNVLFKRLIETFKTPEVIFKADQKSLSQIDGMSERVCRQIRDFSAFDAVDRELEQIEKEGAAILTLNDPAYPPLLSSIYDPPPLLYLKGNLKENMAYPVAVVGARKMTAYGRRATERLCHGLADAGITIVSGFARGVDGLAHRTALSAGARTIAVLGCGIDTIYPSEHKKLFHEIETAGAILSEFPIGTPPVAQNFPRRNRIISGLSLGCVVIEATGKSGSLITARLALEQGREVFAVPGAIFSEMSIGPNKLIASGAKLVQSVEDILDEIRPQLKFRPKAITVEIPPLETEEAVVFQSLSHEPKHIDLLIQESKKTAAAVSSLLLMLELKGIVRQMAGQYYVKM